MSHFTVLVIGPDPEAQLAPYQENNMGDCPKEYLAFNDTEEDMLKQYQTETSKRVVMPDGRLLCTFDDCFKVPDTRPGSFSFSTTFEIPPELEQREVPFTELYPTFEDFATDWHGSRERDPEMNRYGYWENMQKNKVTVCLGLPNPIDEGIGYAKRSPNKSSEYSNGDENVPQMWGDKEVRRFLISEEERGRKIHLLPSVYDGEKSREDSRASTEVASFCEVQNNPGTISEVASVPEWEMCNLPKGGGRERALQEREVEIPCSGSLTPDGSGTGAFMRELQHAFGAGGGKLQLASCDAILPHGPHILKNELIGGSKWDWFQMGGRWTGFYKLKEAVAQIGGVLGTPGLMTPEAEAGHADQLMAGDVDFEGMRTDAAVKAFQQYEDVAQAFGGEIPKIERLWKEVVADESLGGIDARRDFYHAQPALVRLKELQASDGLPKSMDRYFFDLEDFQCDEETYVERAKNSACVPFAFVKESQWYERGRMGWWACVSNEKDRDEWNHQFNKMMDELPANTLLTLVDCHI